MVKQGPYELQVLVGGQPLEEHPFPATGDVYVESKFNTPVSYKGKPETEKDPFGETYEQSWPVTPYTLRVTNTTSNTVYCKVFIDGKEASYDYAYSNKPVEIKGFRDMNSRLRIYNEFLFQLPRRLLKDEKEKLVLSEAERKELKKHLESIRVELYNTEVAYTRDEVDAPTASHKGQFDAINKAVAEATAATSTSGAGRTDMKDMKWGAKTYTYFNLLDKVATLTVRYAQRQKLEQLGIVAPLHPTTDFATSRKKRAADEGAADGGVSAGGAAGAGAGGAAAGGAAPAPAVKVKEEGAKKQRQAAEEVVDLCD